MRRILQLGLLTLALAGSGAAQAVLLSDLFQGGQITAGDKVFDQFSFIQFITFDPARTLTASNIDVTALNDGGMNPGPGLAFAVNRGELDVTGNGDYNLLDFAFSFRVTAPAGLGIGGNSLAFSGGGVSLSTSNAPFVDLGAAIYEWVGNAPVDPSTPGSIGIQASELNGVATSATTASSAFLPQPSVFVTKDILVWASDAGEAASLTGFTQRFAQQPIPEPGTLALLTLAMVGLGARLRRGKA